MVASRIRFQILLDQRGRGAEGIVPGNLGLIDGLRPRPASVGTEGVGCAITTGGVCLNDGPNQRINRRLGRRKRRESCAARVWGFPETPPSVIRLGIVG
jgi:hypothetical protein